MRASLALAAAALRFRIRLSALVFLLLVLPREEKTDLSQPAKAGAALPSREQPPPRLLLFTCTTALLQVTMHITAAAMAATTIGTASTDQIPTLKAEAGSEGYVTGSSRCSVGANPA